VLDRGIAGDILDLEVALAPCTVGYGEIALAIEASPTRGATATPTNRGSPCMPAPRYQALARGAARGSMRWARAMAARRASRGCRRLREGARLEADFWRMGLRG
jgi:thiaminase/transcriptional activator TenA